MEKSPEAFRTISEVAEALDTPAHVLRFWESRFPQIRPVKRAGGRRYYRPSDVALLSGIKRLLHEDGLTIRGVQKILREQGVRHVASLTDAADGLLVDLDGALSDAADPGPGAAIAAPAPERAATVLAFQPPGRAPEAGPALAEDEAVTAPPQRRAGPDPAEAERLIGALQVLRPPLPEPLRRALAKEAGRLASHLGRLQTLMHDDR